VIAAALAVNSEFAVTGFGGSQATTMMASRATRKIDRVLIAITLLFLLRQAIGLALLHADAASIARRRTLS
jgi:hypothetical protein